MNFLSGAACFRLSTLCWCLNCSGNSSTNIPKDPWIIICWSIHPCRRRRWRRRQEIDSSTMDARMLINLNPVETKTDRQRRQKKSQRGQRQKRRGREGRESAAASIHLCRRFILPSRFWEHSWIWIRRRQRRWPEIDSTSKIGRKPMYQDPAEAKKKTGDWFFHKDFKSTHESKSSRGEEEYPRLILP